MGYAIYSVVKQTVHLAIKGGFRLSFSRNDTKVVKGIAIVLMLCHHLFYFPDRIAEGIEYTALVYVGEFSMPYLWGRFGKLCVALFLFLGGYGTYLSCRKFGQDYSGINGTIVAKLKGLYFEYWKVFVVFVPICILAGVEKVNPDIQTMIWNFIGLSTSYCGEWWFLTPYIMLLFTYPIAHRLISKNSDLFWDLMVILLFNMGVMYILPCITEYPWSGKLSGSLFWKLFYQMLSNSSAFYMGCIAAKHNLLNKAKQRFSSGVKNWILAAVVFLAVFCLRHDSYTKYDYIFAPIVTVSVIVMLDRPLFRPIYRFFEKIGQEGTVIWLVHSIYCYMLCQKFVFLPRYTVLILLWLLAMSYATSVLLHGFFGLFRKRN